ncbi:MAG TPA: prolipoprotein diacylglyceryl transferase [Gaiellales bacterium]
MPSPGSSELRLGPFSGHWYGLLVALGGVLFCVVTALIAERRDGRGYDVFWLCLAALPGALIGARVYHLVTGGSGSPGEQALDVGGGGLGIFGAALGGALVLAVGARLRGLDWLRVLDYATPGLALAQAIGRVGNWFNQELYGEPTNRPWGLAIDLEHRPPGLLSHTHFQPTFAFEGVWDLALALVVAWLLLRRRPARRGVALGAWLAGYGAGRFWIEGLRIEPTHHLGPLRLNQVVALGMALAGVTLIGWAGRTRGTT